MEEEEGNRAPLLSKEFYEGCPGCKTDLLKEQTKGIPYKHFSFIWLVSLCTALPSTSLYPFIYFMVRDFHIAKREEDIGYYAGILGSAFMVGRALTSIMWGVAADRYGRRPVILIGVFSVVVFNTLFGLSTSFWMAVSMRFALGGFNSLLGTIRAYASEICSQEHRALSLSVVSTSRGVGLVIGPALGGFLAQPAKRFPSVFAENSIFGRFPYFLPCLVMSLYAVGVFALSWWLPETLHIHNKSGNGKLKSSGKDCEDERNSQESLFKNWPLISLIIVYCVFSLQEMAYSEIFSMWAVSDRKYGGLSFSSQDVGIVLAVSALLSGTTLRVVINVATLLRNSLSVSLVTGLFILLNEAVPQHQRGAANGLSMTAMSIFKAIGPAGGGVIFSWAQARQDAAFLPGDQAVFFTLNVVMFLGLLLTFKPFLAQPTHRHP
ncbi:hypothetical protein V2J09_000128 [Rumex salicifolius]